MMKSGWCLWGLSLSLTACTQTAQNLVDYSQTATSAATTFSSSSDPNASGGASSTATMVRASFDVVESNTFIYLVDTTLNQVLNAAQYQSAGFMPTSDVNVTGSCTKYFSTGGDTRAEGTFEVGSDTLEGDFNLLLDIDHCAVAGSDGNTYIITGSSLELKGTEVTTVDATSGATIDAYQITDLHGTVTITDITGYAVACPVQFTDSLTYVWASNVTVSSSYSGVVCQLPQSGGIGHVLPVTTP